MRTVIAIDIGATSIKAAAVGDDGAILSRATAPTEGAKGPAVVLSNAEKLVKELRAKHPEAAALGVSSCGSISPRTGVVVEATSVMPGWPGTDIKNELRSRCGLPVAVRNDGEAAALGEAVFGAGKSVNVFIMLTLGTGVGGGLVFDGNIFGGESGMAGKLGHMKAVTGGRECACGSKGCLEAYASAYACRKVLGKEPAEAFSAALEGDAAAQTFVREAGEALGRVCADLCNALNPGMIAIGGGIAEGWDQLAPHVEREFSACAMRAPAKAMQIRKALSKNDAGVLGAAVLALRL